MSHPDHECENCGLTHMSYSGHLEFAKKEKRKRIANILLYVGIGMVLFSAIWFMISYAITVDPSALPLLTGIDRSNWSDIKLLYRQLEIGEVSIVTDYSVFTSGKTTLAKANAMIIGVDYYTMKEGTGRASIFEDDYGEVQKLRQLDGHEYTYHGKISSKSTVYKGEKIFLIYELQSNESVKEKKE